MPQDEDVRDLQGKSLEHLRSVWRAHFDAPPALRSPELLGLMLAWRLQALRLGGLDVATRRALRRPACVNRKASLQPGTRLAREWQDALHEVLVSADGGFTHRGKRYRSLSAIALAITGTRWNGPRFFGLRPEKDADGRG